MKRVRVKPGKTQSVMGFAVGLIFCGIGLFLVIPTFGLFGIFWTAIAVAITVASAVNAFSKKGVASHEIIIDDDSDNAVVRHGGVVSYEVETVSGDGAPEGVSEAAHETAKRIESLKELLNAGILTKEEYEERRRRIIDDATK